MDTGGASRDPLEFMEARLAQLRVAPLRPDLDSLPGALYHYTSAHGLIGILSSGELHCTNLLYMNDASELEYGRSVVAANGEEFLRSTHESVRPHLARAIRSLEQPDYHYFISCFCEKPDLLSQWRAYGAQAAGYNVGFSPEDLLALLPSYSAGLVRVIYDPIEQHRMVRKAVLAFSETAEACVTQYPDHPRLEDCLTRWTERLSSILGRLIASMKSEVFAEEHEWRLMIIRFAALSRGDPERGLSGLRFRVGGNGIVVPYLPWSFRRQNLKAVRQLRHGPTVNAALAIRSLGELLFSLGYRDVSVKGSAIPLRAV